MSRFTGATVEEAINKGLNELNLPISEVTTTVKQTPRKGFLGLGARLAEVDVTPIKEEIETQPANLTAGKSADEAVFPVTEELTPTLDYGKVANQLTDYLLSITKQLGIEATANSVVQQREVKVTFTTEQEGLLIGKHGRTINSLQSLAQVYLNHARFSKLAVMLDVAGYRERRLATLTRLSENMAREVVATGKPVYLDPMPSFERKQIHNVLAENDYVMTYSAGTEPKRAVVITPR